MKSQRKERDILGSALHRDNALQIGLAKEIIGLGHKKAQTLYATACS